MTTLGAVAALDPKAGWCADDHHWRRLASRQIATTMTHLSSRKPRVCSRRCRSSPNWS